MRSTMVSSAVHERAVFFEGAGSTSVAGVLTHPARDPVGAGVVVLSGGGFVGSSHRNALTTRICRELAGLGFHTLRFDWHGVGDSTGSVDRFNLDCPFIGDLMGAVSELRGVGVDRFLFFGSCFGARTALAASTDILGVHAMLLIATPVGRRGADHAAIQLAAERSPRELARKGLQPSVLLGLRDPKRRSIAVRLLRAKLGSDAPASRFAGGEAKRARAILVRSLEAALEQGIEITLMYGLADAYYKDLSLDAELMNGLLARPNVCIETVPGELYRYQTVQAQEVVLDRVRTWGAEWATRLGSGDVPC